MRKRERDMCLYILNKIKEDTDDNKIIYNLDYVIDILVEDGRNCKLARKNQKKNFKILWRDFAKYRREGKKGKIK